MVSSAARCDAGARWCAPDPMLAIVLRIKIGLTILWAAPLLLFPKSWLVQLGLPIAEPQMLLVRLLGMAYAALLVGYVCGLRHVRQGQYPRDTVLTGIASNGGACLILAAGAIAGSWSTWGTPARGLMWASLAATAGVAVGLIACASTRVLLHSESD